MRGTYVSEARPRTVVCCGAYMVMAPLLIEYTISLWIMAFVLTKTVRSRTMYRTSRTTRTFGPWYASDKGSTQAAHR